MNVYLRRLQRGVDFIEEHLDEEVALAAVAQAAGLSQWHFQRIFKSITGETVKTYIRSRRMANTLERLLTTNLRILDIALLGGFDTQESFTRAFRKAFGVTPTAYRKMGRGNLFLKKLRLDPEMLKHINQNISLVPTLYHQSAMTLVGCRTLFHGPESEKNNIGSKLPPLWADFLARRTAIPYADQSVCYGVLKSAGPDSDELEYFAAVPVSVVDPPPGMASVHVSAATYAKFEHRGPAAAIDCTVSYAYSTWLTQSEHEHTGGHDLEIYDARYHPTEATSLFYFAMPVGLSR